VALLLGLSVREPARGMSERWLANEEAKPLQLSADETQGQPRDITAIDDAEARAAGWAQAVAELWHRVAFLARLPAFVTHCAVAAVRNAGGYSLGAWLQVFLVRRHGLTPSEFTPWLMVIVPLGTDVTLLFDAGLGQLNLTRVRVRSCAVERRWRPWGDSGRLVGGRVAQT
jgi:hypothetical protein